MGIAKDHDRSREAWELALRQHGVVGREQLLDLGFTNNAIAHRMRRGRLRRLHPQVYAVGRTALTREGRWRAALLWAGPEAALSHSSGAELWKVDDEWAITEISVVGRRRLRTEGVRVHRPARLPPEDIALHAGFRVTTVVRTLIDLAARHSTKRLELAVNAAVRLRLIELGELRHTVAARPGLRGAPHLRKLLDERSFRLTDSELEPRFLPLAAAAGLPVPATRAIVNGFKVDFFWPELGLVVETDGLRYHWTKEQQRRDRLRDHAHSEAGLYPLRFTHEQVAHDPESVIRTLSRIAAQLRPHGTEGAGEAA